MRHALRLTVEPGLARTVGGVLRAQLGASHAFTRRLAAQDGMRLDGLPCTLRHPVEAGATLELSWEEPPSQKVDPEPVPLAVLHEDADVIALDKPSGLVVHPTHGCRHGTLANGLAAYYRAQGISAGIHPLHRLDRHTSGVVLFAKHAFAHQQLDAQLKASKLDRRYWAIATGRLPHDQGTIDAPIARLGGPGGRRGVDPSGQKAVTHYRVLARHGDRTLVELTLETGRTHQIRVHLAHLGHPVVGDPLYGSPHPPERLALHARTLAFVHPRTRQPTLLHAPPPEAFTARLSGWPEANRILSQP